VNPDLTILPLTPERLDDLATLFDQPGDPKWCWCASFHIRGSVKVRPPTANRAVLTARAARDRTPGLIAYRDGRAVGWVSLGPREDFEKLAHWRVLAPVDDRPVWSIVCFVVGRKERGLGLAGDLLTAAIEHARANGATMLEAYPADTGAGRIPSPQAYKGTLSMFERAGFREVARRYQSATTAPRPIVRLELLSVVQQPVDRPDQHPDDHVEPERDQGEEAGGEDRDRQDTGPDPHDHRGARDRRRD
jgi:GNAT superfamily N-acetyltransferase